ncbi:MAG TPA: hypothetical protein VF174_12855 [Micromonosporaceae bacterium]
MRVGKSLPVVAAVLAVLGSAAACSRSAGGPPPAEPPAEVGLGSAAPSSPTPTGGAARTSRPTPATGAPTATGRPSAPALTCAALREAEVTNETVRVWDYPIDSIRLTDGRWAAEDGTEITLQDPCGLGDLNRDGVVDAVGTALMAAGGTGRFISIIAWTGGAAQPRLAAAAMLGDRTPVLSIRVAGGRATVVYLTRTPDAPAAAVNLRRTAVFELSGTDLVEVGHTDEPYTPS